MVVGVEASGLGRVSVERSMVGLDPHPLGVAGSMGKMRSVGQLGGMRMVRAEEEMVIVSRCVRLVWEEEGRGWEDLGWEDAMLWMAHRSRVWEASVYGG